MDLTAILDAKFAYSNADFVVIAVPVNFDSQKKFFGTSAVETVIILVMEYNPPAIMVIKSTIPVGYTKSVREKTGSKNIIFALMSTVWLALTMQMINLLTLQKERGTTWLIRKAYCSL